MKNGKNKKKKEGEKMIILKGIDKSFSGRVVLDGVDFSFSENEGIALVGPNGSGKSTLMKIIIGVLKPDRGTVEIDSGLEIGYFPQEISREDQEKTGENFLTERMKIKPEKLLREIDLLAKKIDFPLKKVDNFIKDLSGGEKSKLVLISVLKSKANFFLLDEPTNNLDLKGFIILEDFLKKSNKGFLVVSHDRKFLDKLVDNVLEIEEHNIEVYRNLSYSSYLNARRKKKEKEREQYENYQEEKKRLFRSAIKKKQEASKMASSPKKRRDKDKYAVGFKKDRSRKIASHASNIEKRMEDLKEEKKTKKILAA